METQLELFGDSAPAPVEPPLAEAFRRLAPLLKATVVYTAARRRIFSWRSDPGGTALVLRVGEEFRQAPRAIADAVVRIVTRRRLPRAVRQQLFFEVRCWLAEVTPCGGATGRCLPPEGRHVDLRPVLERVNASHFRKPIAARICWSPRPARHLMGRFERGSPAGLVVVNRLLDCPLSPRWYLEFLVYHELLHAVIPPRPGSTRLLVHPPEFRRMERRHPDHARARLFERWASGPGFRILLDPLRRGAKLPARFREPG